MTITLSSETEQIVSEKVKSGAYQSADEVISRGVRLLDAQEKGTARGEARANNLRNLKNLLRETQSLPQAQILSDDDILHEVETHRNGLI